MQKATDAVAFCIHGSSCWRLIYIQCSQLGGVIWQFFGGVSRNGYRWRIQAEPLKSPITRLFWLVMPKLKIPHPITSRQATYRDKFAPVGKIG